MLLTNIFSLNLEQRVNIDNFLGLVFDGLNLCHIPGHLHPTLENLPLVLLNLLSDGHHILVIKLNFVFWVRGL